MKIFLLNGIFNQAQDGTGRKRSWGDALSKQSSELFVAKADESYARSLEEP